MAAQPIGGFMGGAARGKSTAGRELFTAAGVPACVRVIETSDHIYALTKLVISWVVAQGQTVWTDSLTRRALWALPGMFVAAGCDPFGIPDSEYNVLRNLSPSDAHWATLAAALAEVAAEPTKFLREITVATKSDFRRLMTALNRLTSEVLAVPWLQRNGWPEARNLWPVIAWQEIDDLAARYPGIPLLICSGLRMPGDADGLRDRNGYLFQRLRPVTTDGDDLETEKQYLTPDYVIDGDCTLEELARFMAWLWSRLHGRNALPAGLAQAEVINIAETLAAL